MSDRNSGDWQVTRFCCNSGCCFDCRDRGTHGDLSKRARIVHCKNVSEAYARRTALGWVRFDAKAEPMRSPFGRDARAEPMTPIHCPLCAKERGVPIPAKCPHVDL